MGIFCPPPPATHTGLLVYNLVIVFAKRLLKGRGAISTVPKMCSDGPAAASEPSERWL